MGIMNVTEAVPALIQLLRDKNRNMRQDAAEVINATSQDGLNFTRDEQQAQARIRREVAQWRWNTPRRSLASTARAGVPTEPG